MPELPVAAVLLDKVGADPLRIPFCNAGAVRLAQGLDAQRIPDALGGLAIAGQDHAGGGDMMGDEIAEAEVVPNVAQLGIHGAFFIQRLLELVRVLHHIVVGDLVHPHIIAPVGAQGGGLSVLGLGDPEGVQLLPALVVHLEDLPPGHEILDLFDIPDADDPLIVGIILLFHLHASSLSAP